MIILIKNKVFMIVILIIIIILIILFKMHSISISTSPLYIKEIYIFNDENTEFNNKLLINGTIGSSIIIYKNYKLKLINDDLFITLKGTVLPHLFSFFYKSNTNSSFEIIIKNEKINDIKNIYIKNGNSLRLIYTLTK